MRYVCVSFLLILPSSAGLFAQAEFAPEERILTGDAPLDVACFRGAAPFLGDFDGDGLNDLLIGHEESGRLRIYRNQGTNEKPKFDDYEFFRADGAIAELPIEGEFHPQLVDLNGDGDLDLLSVSESGLIFWYRRTAAGTFAEAELLKLGNGQALSAGTFPACHAADWDGDGDFDLIVSGRRSENQTEIVLVENIGSPQSMSLSSPQPLTVDDQPLVSSQAFAYPFVADWNRDGKNDLLLGLSNGSVLLYENSAATGQPKLTQPRVLIQPPKRKPPGAEDAEIQRGRGGSFCVCDWNNDGLLDLLLGDQQSERIQPELTNEAQRLEQSRQEAARILREYRRVRRLAKKLDETQQTQKEFLQQTREKFAQQLSEINDKISKLEAAMQPQWKNHGYVWLLRSTKSP